MRAYRIDEPGGIRIVAPYLREFVDALRTEIPYHSREFDPDTKSWVVDRGWEHALVTVVMRYYDALEPLVRAADAEARERRAAERERMNASGQPSHSPTQCLAAVRRIYREEAEVGVFPPAESEAVIRACYRARALQLHPDVAGPASHAAMVALNRAYETLLKTVKRASA